MLVASALFTFTVSVATAAAPEAGAAARADLLLVVDCLLPGQVRTLGQRSTYLSARRPARLPARDCQIRGGEYVAYDRADIKSALAAWEPLAARGDTEAQVIVGEIHERGLGVAPDFAAAARWYRLAAEAGDRRAQVNLGYLLERGLGMAADPQAAIEWYRRAAGREAVVAIEPGVAEDTAAAPLVSTELVELRLRAQQLEAALGQLRSALEDSRQTITSAESRALAAEAAARELANRVPQQPDDAAEVAALHAALQQRSRDADELGRALAAARREQDRQRIALEESSRQLVTTGADLAAERRRLEEADRRLEAQAAELATQRTETERLGRELVVAADLSERRQQEVERLAKLTTERLLAGPQLTLIEPALVATRDIVPVATVSGTTRQVVGRATAPAGLVALTVNDIPVAINPLGVFTTSVKVTAGDAPVHIVAVDNQGKRSELRFLLRSASGDPARASGPSLPASRSVAERVEFGSYHALIIGNNDYRHLPDLASPVNDATELAELLERRYGFRTTVLLNADRYQILSALNALRETLTPNDNLLVYFAGHGELDEVNQRGHWLPIDAERDSTANWIPTTAITDILNIVRAKQVLLVVDSCYAGALTRSSMARLATGMTEQERLHWLRTMASKRSRTVLTSGGIAPVMDAGGGRHSVFAKALLEVLSANGDTLDGQRLYREVAARVAYAAANLRFDQVPEYAPIRYAGHEGGEFFLIPGS